MTAERGEIVLNVEPINHEAVSTGKHCLVSLPPFFPDLMPPGPGKLRIGFLESTIFAVATRFSTFVTSICFSYGFFECYASWNKHHRAQHEADIVLCIL